MNIHLAHLFQMFITSFEIFSYDILFLTQRVYKGSSTIICHCIIYDLTLFHNSSIDASVVFVYS